MASLTGLLSAATALAGPFTEPAGTARAPLRLRAPAIPVTAGLVAQKAIPLEIQAIGTVQAYSSVTVESQVDGRIGQVHFTQGQEVKQGDLLFTLDQQPFQAALAQAQANLGRDTAQLQQAEAAVGQTLAAHTQAEADLARDQAQLEYARAEDRRYQELIVEGAISKEQYGQVHAAALAAEATIRADQAAIDNAAASIRAARATVESARAAVKADQAAVETARIQLGYTLIRAPMDGRTGSLLVFPGSVVKGSTTNLVVINQVHPIYVSFSVPEQDLAEVRKFRAAGDPAVATYLAGEARPAAYGTLTFIDNTVNATTGTIQLMATFPNRNDSLWPGQFVSVVLTLAIQPHRTVVPSQAVQIGQQGSYVFVIKPNRTVEVRPVVVGQTLESETVVEQGLHPGEQVVTDGQSRLYPGAHVEIKASLGGGAPAGAGGIP